MTDTVRDLIEVAMRLSQLRDAPPPSLRLHLRQRDGPAQHHEPKPAPERVTGPHNAPQRPSGQLRGIWKTKFQGS